MQELSALKTIAPEKVKNFLEELNAALVQKDPDKKLIAAIGTGGTISMKVENGIRVPDLDFDQIFAHVGEDLGDKFEVVSLDAMCIDSSQMNYHHVQDLALVMSYIWENLTSPINGFLILHGTDTMAHSAAAISLMMGPGLPFSVVYTGGQKSIQEPMNDAASNLRHALYTLESLRNNDMAEVIIVMGERAILGTSAVKVTDTLADAFDAPLHKYVANFSALEYPVRLALWLRKRRENVEFTPVIPTEKYSRTLVIHSTLGLDPNRLKQQLCDDSIEAILLFSYGAGTADQEIINVITKSAQKRKLPAFVVSPVNTEYKIAYESGKELIEKGVTPLHMTLPSALAKIEIALTLYGQDTKAISEFVAQNYVGEIPSEASQFSPLLER